MKKLYIYAGIAASCLMIAVGIGAVVMGFEGRSTVRDELAREQIVGTPDMKGVANEKIDTGSEARDFAAGMREHTLAATQGQTYAEMARFLDENGKPTADEEKAAVDPKSGEPVSNPAREIWITETALANALNTSYFAENVANFAIVVGFALLLSGIGFLVLTLRLPWRPEETETETTRRAGPRWRTESRPPFGLSPRPGPPGRGLSSFMAAFGVPGAGPVGGHMLVRGSP